MNFDMTTKRDEMAAQIFVNGLSSAKQDVFASAEETAARVRRIAVGAFALADIFHEELKKKNADEDER